MAISNQSETVEEVASYILLIEKKKHPQSKKTHQNPIIPFPFI